MVRSLSIDSIHVARSSAIYETHVRAYLHDRRPEVDSLRSDRAVPELSELANRCLNIVGVLGGALVCATLGKAHVGVDLAGRHLGAERPDTEAGRHDGRRL